jgi:geranylgeranyl diphosphate synthase, type II
VPATPLANYLKKQAALVETFLAGELPRKSAHPRKLHEAMRYSIQAGGKRLRPILVLAASELAGGKVDAALPAAAAVECIHTYSLIHDDLPCMDNDDLRRGLPTCHKAFGEAIALLAGDALLTAAFDFVARVPSGKRYGAAEYVTALAGAAGSRELIGGQTADMEAEGAGTATAADLRRIHSGKTAAMISVSLRLGAMSAQAPDAEVRALADFGRDLGLAFQIIDDILDVTQTAAVLGKSPGKDAAAGKATYPSVLGLDASHRAAKKMTARALKRLEPFGSRAGRLMEIADFLLLRNS